MPLLGFPGGATGADGADGAPGGGGSNAPDAVGVECAAVTLGDVPAERFLCAVGGSARTVTGFWFVNMGSSPMTANDTNLLSFTVNCRSADGTITATDYASTGTTGGSLQGVGTVDPLALGAYTFAAALTAPAGGHITVEHAKSGLGKALEAYVMGVYFGAGA